MKDNTMGSGAFGTVLAKKVACMEFVAKVIQREKGTPEEIEENVCEVAINKLCAMHSITPNVETSIPFDLIVYDDAMQLHFEKVR
jgi:glycerol-3-phosphate dehydrogenase